MNKLISILTMLFVLLLLGCGGNEKNEGQKSEDQTNNQEDHSGMNQDKDDDNDVMQGMKNFSDMMKQGQKVEVIDFRKLKELLPAELTGMTRTSAQGEKTNSFGIKVSQSEGEYKSENGEQNIKITIIDLGSMKGLAGMAVFAWTMVEIDKETDDGYEKTTQFKGYKAFEKYSTTGKNGSLEVIVGDRFMVKGEGWGTEMNTIKDAVGSIDLGTLESMKNEGKEDS